MRPLFPRRARLQQELRLRLSKHGAAVHFVPTLRPGVLAPPAPRLATHGLRRLVAYAAPLAFLLCVAYLLLR